MLPPRLYTFPIYDRLLTLDRDLQLRPMIARTWSFAPDGRQLTLRVRADARFHDGTRVDATAVKFSLDRAKALPGSTAAASLTSIDAVTVVDGHTVLLALNRATSDLLFELAGPAGSIINPKMATADLSQGTPDAAGSGPWVVSHFAPNDAVTYRRAPTRSWDRRRGTSPPAHDHLSLRPDRGPRSDHLGARRRRPRPAPRRRRGASHPGAPGLRVWDDHRPTAHV